MHSSYQADKADAKVVDMVKDVRSDLEPATMAPITTDKRKNIIPMQRSECTRRPKTHDREGSSHPLSPGLNRQKLMDGVDSTIQSPNRFNR